MIKHGCERRDIQEYLWASKTYVARCLRKKLSWWRMCFDLCRAVFTCIYTSQVSIRQKDGREDGRGRLSSLILLWQSETSQVLAFLSVCNSWWNSWQCPCFIALPSVKALTREKETFFTALFSKQWQLERDPDDKSIFIDRDGKLFNHVFGIFTNRQDTDWNVEHWISLTTTHHWSGVLSSSQSDLSIKWKKSKEKGRRRRRRKWRLVDSYFPDGTLLETEQKRKLNEFYGKSKQRWYLIYKASRDSFDANEFHSRCDNRGATVTVIRSNNNYLSGGHTAIPWTSGGTYKSDTSAFLFTLINPHAIPPTEYMIKPTSVRDVVNRNSGYGPTCMFGGGSDLRVANNSDATNSCSTSFPHTYSDTTGKGNNTFTAARNFTTSDIEVFKVG